MKHKSTILSAVGIASLLLIYQNCSGSGDGGTVNTPAVAATAISCVNAGMDGAWSGQISGNPDTMTISPDCVVTSTYCESRTEITLASINSNCPPSATTCGSGVARSKSSNGKTTCFKTGAESQCQFAVSKNGNSTLLQYNCGGGTITVLHQ